MKKKYIQPEVKDIYINQKVAILAGSLYGDNAPGYDPNGEGFDDEEDI